MPTKWRSPRCCNSPPSTPRRAFTLAEVLLVLAVLVVIAAFAVPAVKGSLDNYRLRKSADTIRSAFATARATAARTGVTHIFQYTPESATYSIQPWSTGDEYIEISAAPTIDMGSTPSAATSPMQPVKVTPLPDGILFHSVVTSTSVRDLRTISNSGDTTAALGSAPQGATPILFYSDGSSSNATLTLKNGRGAFVEIKLRGLTGYSSASKLLSGGQLSSSQSAGS
jgi:prepilin-type N-terminal cleavage/methylation domain-containing protein